MPPKRSPVQAHSPSPAKEHLQEDHSHRDVAFEELILTIHDMQISLEARITAVEARLTAHLTAVVTELANHS